MTLVYRFRYADNVFEKINSDFTPNSPISILPIEADKVILSGSREGLDEFRKLARRLDQKPGDVARSSETDDELVQ